MSYPARAEGLVNMIISNSFWPFTKPLVTYRAHLLQWLSTSLSCSILLSVLEQDPGSYLSYRFLLILLCGPPERPSLLFGRFPLFLLLTITRSCILAGIKWSVCIWKSQRALCVSFFRTESGLCIYLLFVL